MLFAVHGTGLDQWKGACVDPRSIKMEMARHPHPVWGKRLADVIIGLECF